MVLPVFKTNAPPVLSQVLAWEADPHFCREPVTVLAGSSADRDLALGTVLGQIALGAATVTAGGGNTGAGTVGSVTRGAACKVGTYRLTCIAAASNAGRFQVVDPDGNRLADALVAVAYAQPQLGFTIADGDPDFAVGDSFTIAFAAGSNKVIALKLDATDGSQHAAGVLLGHVIAPDGVDAPGLASWRDSHVLPSGLVWPAGITTDQKNAALAELAAKRIFTRTEA